MLLVIQISSSLITFSSWSSHISLPVYSFPYHSLLYICKQCVNTDTGTFRSHLIFLCITLNTGSFWFSRTCVCGGSACITSPGSPACLVYLSCVFSRLAGELDWNMAELHSCSSSAFFVSVHPQDAGMIHTHLMTKSLCCVSFPQELESGRKCVQSVMVVRIVLGMMWKMCVICFPS